MRILLIEDSLALAKAIRIALEQTGYAVDHSAEGDEGFYLISENNYDAAIVDIMLPGMNGIEIVKKLRTQNNKTKVIFLTAKDTIEDRVHGLQEGADDYLVKPFAMDELLARVAVLCRRSYNQAHSIVSLGLLEVDTQGKQAKFRGQPFSLRAREYNLLEYLILRKEQVVSRSEIEEHIYDELSSPMSNVVDASVYSLRKSLKSFGEDAPIIETRRGQGYILYQPN